MREKDKYVLKEDINLGLSYHYEWCISCDLISMYGKIDRSPLTKVISLQQFIEAYYNDNKTIQLYFVLINEKYS